MLRKNETFVAATIAFFLLFAGTIHAQEDDATSPNPIIQALNREFLRELLRNPDEFLLAYLAWHKSKPTLDNDPRFTLHETDNIWTFLLLDTATGKTWQVGYSINEEGLAGRIPINTRSLISEDDPLRHGRFKLNPTNNMWNFILLDQDTGRVWQLQFSTRSEPGYRWIVPLTDLE